MLVDDVAITIKAGDGGNGAVHFRRNAQTAKGGPDGGNGGNGGNVYFQGIDDISALRQFRFKKRIEAENGVKGGRQNLYGRNGKDLVVHVPFGTIMTELATGKRYTITRIVPNILLAKGGKGGRGNNEFKTATDQAPKYAEQGEQGEEKEVRIELKLIADIGFIGLPNAGKSSLLQALTNAHPKIANYPFTTLEPNIGVLQNTPAEGAWQVARGNNNHELQATSHTLNLILADIPGLIEGASAGKGLGIKFLRHIERTKLLVHCIASDNEDVIQAYQTVRKELGEYNKEILNKPEIIVLTKKDLMSEEDLNNMVKLFKDKQIISVSIFDGESIKNLMDHLAGSIL